MSAMDRQPPAPAATRRRWYQFSLRTFFVLITLVAVVVSIAGYWGSVLATRVRLSSLGVTPVSVVGVDGNPGGYGIFVEGRQVDDDALARIVDLLPRSRYITRIVVLDNVSASPSGLEKLQSLRDLECVYLQHCPRIQKAGKVRSELKYEVIVIAD
jgi:hypothetical protein